MCRSEAKTPGPTGACGISCWVCRAYLGEACTCSAGDSPDVETAMALQERRWGKPCPILVCAAQRSVSHCGRDCADYPCDLLNSSDSPLSESYLAMMERRMKAAGSQ